MQDQEEKNPTTPKKRSQWDCQMTLHTTRVKRAQLKSICAQLQTDMSQQINELIDDFLEQVDSAN